MVTGLVHPLKNTPGGLSGLVQLESLARVAVPQPRIKTPLLHGTSRALWMGMAEQTFGSIRNDPVVNMSKIGLDGKAANGRWCFRELFTEEKCLDSNCLGSHVPPNRRVLTFILSLQAKDPRTGADLNRNFYYNVLKTYYKKHFLQETTSVLTPRWYGTPLTDFPWSIQRPFYRRAEVPAKHFSRKHH
jgi:hypothetical protein